LFPRKSRENATADTPARACNGAHPRARTLVAPVVDRDGIIGPAILQRLWRAEAAVAV